MCFEYDSNKSDANKVKHGIDFEEAQTLWLDESRIVIPTRHVAEPRELIIAKLRGKLWTAVVTRREDRIRIISVRRSRQEEKDVYGGE